MVGYPFQTGTAYRHVLCLYVICSCRGVWGAVSARGWLSLSCGWALAVHQAFFTHTLTMIYTVSSQDAKTSSSFSDSFNTSFTSSTEYDRSTLYVQHTSDLLWEANNVDIACVNFSSIVMVSMFACLLISKTVMELSEIWHSIGRFSKFLSAEISSNIATKLTSYFQQHDKQNNCEVCHLWRNLALNTITRACFIDSQNWQQNISS